MTRLSTLPKTGPENLIMSISTPSRRQARARESRKIPAGAYSAMTDYPEDVYTEPSDVDVHTPRNTGLYIRQKSQSDGRGGRRISWHCHEIS
jgi:hypothetical protein